MKGTSGANDENGGIEQDIKSSSCSWNLVGASPSHQLTMPIHIIQHSLLQKTHTPYVYPMSQGNRLHKALAGLDRTGVRMDRHLVDELTGTLRLPQKRGEFTEIDNDDKDASFQMPDSWLKEQTIRSQRLSPKLRRPSSVLGRMKMGLLQKTRANLCQAHEVLDPRLVRDVFEMFMNECLSRNDYLRDVPYSCEPHVKAWLGRLKAAAGIWLGPCRRGLPGAVVYPRLESRCEACMLAVIGGNERLLTDLFVSARVHQRSVGDKMSYEGGEDADRFCTVLQSWILHLDMEGERGVNRGFDHLFDSVVQYRYHVLCAARRSRPCKLRDSEDQKLSDTREQVRADDARPDPLHVEPGQYNYSNHQQAIDLPLQPVQGLGPDPAIKIADHIDRRDFVSPLGKLARGQFPGVNADHGSHVPQVRKAKDRVSDLPYMPKPSRGISFDNNNHWVPSQRR